MRLKGKGLKKGGDDSPEELAGGMDIIIRQNHVSSGIFAPSESAFPYTGKISPFESSGINQLRCIAHFATPCLAFIFSWEIPCPSSKSSSASMMERIKSSVLIGVQSASKPMIGSSAVSNFFSRR